MSAGRTAGNVTRRKTYQRDPPSVRAASSKRRSSCRSAASIVRIKNGIATNVWARTTPLVENGSVTPNHRSRYWPNNPRRPNEKNSATPPTTGGSTIDKVHRARTAARPGKSTLASNHANGTPNTSDNAVAHSEHWIESTNAVRTESVVRTSHASPHGTRQSKPMNGSAKNAIATPASTSTGSGSTRIDTRRPARLGSVAAVTSSRNRSSTESPDRRVTSRSR